MDKLVALLNFLGHAFAMNDDNFAVSFSMPQSDRHTITAALPNDAIFANIPVPVSMNAHAYTTNPDANMYVVSLNRRDERKTGGGNKANCKNAHENLQ
jgi:hypothetical protein